MSIKIQFLRAEDWIGMYIDGRLVDEGHSLEEQTVARHIVEALDPHASVTATWEDDSDLWEYMAGRCPLTWDGFEREKAEYERALEEQKGVWNV